MLECYNTNFPYTALMEDEKQGVQMKKVEAEVEATSNNNLKCYNQYGECFRLRYKEEREWGKRERVGGLDSK